MNLEQNGKIFSSHARPVGYRFFFFFLYLSQVRKIQIKYLVYTLMSLFLTQITSVLYHRNENNYFLTTLLYFKSCNLTTKTEIWIRLLSCFIWNNRGRNWVKETNHYVFKLGRIQGCGEEKKYVKNEIRIQHPKILNMLLLGRKEEVLGCCLRTFVSTIGFRFFFFFY